MHVFYLTSYDLLIRSSFAAIIEFAMANIIQIIQFYKKLC